MKKLFQNFLLIISLVLLFSHCAKKGRPSGGPKDTIPPVILKSNPEIFTTHFNDDEIRIYFDEYIKLKDIQQNLVVSPPLKYQPIVTPTTSAKVLKIRILDTLKENTTYAFNFGKSIVDNNEENEYEYYKYVFSTGDYIDSLTLKGIVGDIVSPKLEKKVTVMLYEYSDTFNDSIVFSDKPTYVGRTTEKNPSFDLTNLKEGSYKLLALQEEVNNYTFEPKKDKIAFIDEPIQLPTDSSFVLQLFKETPDYKIGRASHISKHKITFGFEGPVDSLQLEPLFELPEDYQVKILRDPKKDSLNYWFQPAFDINEIDTLQFLAKNLGQIDTLVVKMRDLYVDSLHVSLIGGTSIIPRDSIKFELNTPLSLVHSEKFVVLDKDSLQIPAEVFLDEEKNWASLYFPKKDEQLYKVKILPEAIFDFFGNTNDTLSYGFRTKPLSDYGTINFVIENLKEFPVIVELVDQKLQVIATDYLTENREVYFDYLNPNKYFLRMIYDKNGNKKWDTGNYLRKLQPEEIIYYPAEIEIRANWSLNESFKLE
jgi:uncharacterized protein (DUF2141 family)